jgi:PAS domain-containing protein
LANMRDRMGAVGGRLLIESAHGQGTCVAGTAPFALVDGPPQMETLLRRATDALDERLAIYRAVRGERGCVVDFRIEHLNEAACVEMGRDRDELVGRQLGELVHGFPESTDFGWLRQVLEEDTKDSRTRLERDGRAAALSGGRVVVTWRDVREQTPATGRAVPTALSARWSRGRSC